MRIAVVGAGSMGSLFGGLLSLGGDDVWLVDRWAEHVAAVRAEGLRLTHGERRWRATPGATTDPAEVGPVDLVILLCKSADTRAAAAAARPMLRPETILATLQNGLGNPEAIAEATGATRIVAGVTAIGAAIVAPGHVEITAGAANGEGGTWIGAWRGGVQPSEVEGVAARFRAANILTHVADDVEAVIWNKLAMAAGMAALTGVARLPTDAVSETEDGRALLTDVIDEIVRVAAAKGVALDREKALESAFATYRVAQGHVTSMAADVAARRPTEIEALNGAVAAEAERLGVAAPVNLALARLVRVIERGYDRQLA